MNVHCVLASRGSMETSRSSMNILLPSKRCRTSRAFVVYSGALDYVEIFPDWCGTLVLECCWHLPSHRCFSRRSISPTINGIPRPALTSMLVVFYTSALSDFLPFCNKYHISASYSSLESLQESQAYLRALAKATPATERGTVGTALSKVHFCSPCSSFPSFYI